MKKIYIQYSLFGFLCCLSVVPLKAQAQNISNLQRAIATVDKMPRVPAPLAVRPWAPLSQAYYQRVLDPNAAGDNFPFVTVDAGKPGFRIKTYAGGNYDTEAFSALLAVVGAKLSGLDLSNLHGVDYVERAKAWYDPELGLYRHRIGERSPVVHADIYGYWPAIQGLMLAAQYPDDPDFQRQANTTFAAFKRIAEGLGGAEKPNYNVLGWDFQKKQPAGRPEPMNKLGNAPSVAWALLAGSERTGDATMLADARAAMQWYIGHSGRYEISHVMGPLTAARLNTLPGEPLDLDQVLDAWFGDGPLATSPWAITSGTHLNGMTADGLDGARWENNGFYAFTMGSLQGPAWLVPVVRYDQRYARAIGRYALNAANSARLLQGYGLDALHQDHATWKAQWDLPELLFYEGVASQGPGNAGELAPYARGDVVLNGWNADHPRVPENQYLQQRDEWFGDTSNNIALYMGNSVGFLGGIVKDTNLPGILSWDCLATDWYHPKAYPTHLFYNPFEQRKVVRVDVEAASDLYNTVEGRFIKRNAQRGALIDLKAGEAAVIVQVPVNAKIEQRGTQLLANGIVIDYRFQPGQTP